MIPLSIASDSDLTANLSPALRAARVEAQCPSEAAVRALDLCGGVNPSNPPHKVSRALFPGGDGLRPAGLTEGEHSPAVRHGITSIAGRMKCRIRPGRTLAFSGVKAFPS